MIGAAGGSVAAKSQQSTAEGSSWRRRPCSLQRSRWPARSRAGPLQAAPDEPRVNCELRELILRMSKENPLWGARAPFRRLQYRRSRAAPAGATHRPAVAIPASSLPGTWISASSLSSANPRPRQEAGWRSGLAEPDRADRRMTSTCLAVFAWARPGDRRTGDTSVLNL